jgi:hypothetical protein
MLTADQWLATNSSGSLVTLNAGGFSATSGVVSNGLAFVVGDGVDAATYHLLGGVHSFANNLEIHNNATLSGCGTINGNVVVDAGGTVLADCGGTLTFAGSVTNNATMLAVNGSILEAYGLVVNNGIIDIRSGTTNFLAGFINNGLVVTTNSIPVVTAIQVVGLDVQISVMTGNEDTYVFEEATNPVAPNWTPVIGFAGTGGVVTFIDPGAATLPQRFYRIGLIPSP